MVSICENSMCDSNHKPYAEISIARCGELVLQVRGVGGGGGGGRGRGSGEGRDDGRVMMGG